MNTYNLSKVLFLVIYVRYFVFSLMSNINCVFTQPQVVGTEEEPLGTAESVLTEANETSDNNAVLRKLLVRPKLFFFLLLRVFYLGYLSLSFKAYFRPFILCLFESERSEVLRSRGEQMGDLL